MGLRDMALRWDLNQQSNKILAQTCTNACIRNLEMDFSDMLELLAGALRDCLPPDKCRQLAELLVNRRSDWEKE